MRVYGEGNAGPGHLPCTFGSHFIACTSTPPISHKLRAMAADAQVASAALALSSSQYGYVVYVVLNQYIVVLTVCKS